MKHEKLTVDQWGRQEVYVAEWQNSIGACSRCLFSNLDAAIFFVVSGLGLLVDWDNFPDPAKKYPYEDRNGTQRFTPVFRVEQTCQTEGWGVGKRLTGSVTKMSIADEWTVGNGIAEISKDIFFKATGRDEVFMNGKGSNLSGRVGKEHHDRNQSAKHLEI